MLKLRPFQQEAVDFLLSAMAEHSDMTFRAPVGCGRTIIVVEAARRFDGPIAISSRHRAIRDQYAAVIEKSGATNISVVPTRFDPADFLAVILDEDQKRDDLKDIPVVTLT